MRRNAALMKEIERQSFLRMTAETCLGALVARNGSDVTLTADEILKAPRLVLSENGEEMLIRILPEENAQAREG